MIIACNTFIPAENKDLNYSWENETYTFVWKGLVYIPGIKAGSLSVEHMSHCLSEGKTIAEATLPLKGDFFLMIRDKKQQINYALIDHNGMFQAFYTDRLIGTSYLELIRYLKIKKSDLSKEAIVEFLHLNNIFFKRTFTNCIKKISSEDILTFASDGTIKRLKKPLRPIVQNPMVTINDFFQNLSNSISKEHVSIDITGGFDTRLIACMLMYYGLDYEVAISGVEDYEEIIIAKEVAAALNKEFHVTYHNIDHLLDDIQLLFTYADGLSNVLEFHRLFQLQRDRKQRGITLSISGPGGEFFKDYWWLQDFPFYNRSMTNITKL